MVLRIFLWNIHCGESLLVIAVAHLNLVFVALSYLFCRKLLKTIIRMLLAFIPPDSQEIWKTLVSKLVLSIRSAVGDGSLCSYHYCWVLWQYRTLVTAVETANANVCLALELLNNGSAGFADMLRGNVLVFPVSSFICSLSHCTFMFLTAGIVVS